MQESLYIAASGGMIQQRKLETLANNLANVSTTGFKKDGLVFKEILPTLNPDLDFESTRTALLEPKYSQRSVGYAAVNGFATHYKQGALLSTGNPLDVALEGDGFFAVQTQEGVRYTRKGNFHLDEENRIVSASGQPLLSESDQDLVVPPNSGEVTIDPQGAITVGNATQTVTIGQLKRVQFRDKSQLQKDGDSLFRQVWGDTPEKASPTTTVKQGFTESSNVSVVEEMVNLIIGQRAYDSNARVVETSDQMLQTATNLKR